MKKVSEHDPQTMKKPILTSNSWCFPLNADDILLDKPICITCIRRQVSLTFYQAAVMSCRNGAVALAT
jgi:hypothetical protein